MVGVGLVKTLKPPGRFACGTLALVQLTGVPLGFLNRIRIEAGCSSSIWTWLILPGLTVTGALAGLALFQETRLPGIVAM